MSKDPSTKVGAVIAGPDREVRSMGFNGFPRGVNDTSSRLNDREEKLQLVVHGEMNAVLHAARMGTAIKGCSLYLAAVGADGLIWGGAPCIRCTVEIIQAGITQIVAPPHKNTPERWLASVKKSMEIIEEVGLSYRTVELERDYV